MKTEIEEHFIPPKLKNEEYFPPFRETVIKIAHAIDPQVVYRTFIAIPASERDEKPRALRKYNIGEGELPVYSEEQMQNMTEDDIIDEVKRYGFSVNNSRQAALDAFEKDYLKKTDKKPKQRRKSAEKDRGIHLCTLNLTSNAGYIEDFDDEGHANFYPFEDVSLEDYREENYEIINLDEYEDKISNL